MAAENYVIRGGSQGRERLRLLSDVMGASTSALLDDASIKQGSVCVDIGCGGGDVALDLARRVGPAGRVVGLDHDGAKLEIARQEAVEQGVANVEFRICDVTSWQAEETYAVAYSRFLLSHISDPARLLSVVHRALEPGGLVIVEDVDFRGHFSEPRCPAFDRYVELYTESVRRRGGNAAIGPILPALLHDAGFEGVGQRISHPVARVAGIKLLSLVTLESISGAVMEDKLISEADLRVTIEELRAFAEDPETVIGGPRVVQVWGTKQ